MHHLTAPQLLSMICSFVQYPISINPYFRGLEYFELFNYDVIMAPIDKIPFDVCNEIAGFFANDILMAKKVEKPESFKVTLIRASVEVHGQILLGYKVKVMIWYNYEIQKVKVSKKKLPLGYPVTLKVERPSLR